MAKIGYIMTPVDFGGAEKVALNYFRNSHSIKHTLVPIVLIRPWEIENNVVLNELKKIPCPFFEIPVAIHPREEGRDYFRVFRCYKLINDIMKKEHFDLLHLNGYFADIVGIPLSKKFKIPSLSMCHGFIMNNYKYKIYNALDFKFLRFSTKIVAVSEEIRNTLLNKGIKDKNIEVLPNAVSVDGSHEKNRMRETIRRSAGVQPSDFVLGFVGRLSPEKGIDLLLDAMSDLIRNGFPGKLVIVGDGPLRGVLEGIVQERHLEKHVFFTGFRRDIESMMSSFDLYVLPSLTEGTPIALLEAMAMGVPVIASRVGGIPDIIDNRINGILVESGNIEPLKDSIMYLYKNKDIRNNMSDEAVVTIKSKYDITTWCGKIGNIYDNLLMV